MFDVDGIYWYKLVFLTELLLSEALFFYKLKRRTHFLIRLPLTILLLYALCFFLPVLDYGLIYMSCFFLVIFVLTMSGACLCFKEPFQNILFCGIAAYTIQHIAYVLDMIVVNLSGFTPLPLYKPEIETEPQLNILMIFIYIASYFLTYWSGFFLLSKKMELNENLRLGNSKYLILSGIIVLVDIILNMVTESNETGNRLSSYIEWVYNLLTCIFALVIQFGMLSKKKIEVDLNTVDSLMKAEEKQFKSIKANYDAINIKVHDLKHYISALKAGDRNVTNEELDEIQSMASFYDSVARTGNEALDIILTEKLSYCNKHSIRLTYIVDGKLLSFMKATDIYALFGNAIDNAIEAVLRLDKEKRNISFSVKSHKNMIILHVENPFDGKIRMKDGLPLTRKEDNLSHGYGTLSMKVVAEKYGGTFSIDVRERIFSLNVIFMNHESDVGTDATSIRNI